MSANFIVSVCFIILKCLSQIHAAKEAPDMTVYFKPQNISTKTANLRNSNENFINNEIVDQMLNLFPKQMSSVSISSVCFNDTMMVKNSILSKQQQQYALKFIDAQAKIPHGILQGKWFWEGDYQECIGIRSPYNVHTKHTFSGKYFSVKVRQHYIPLQSPFGFGIGVCLPDSCDKDDAMKIVDLAFASIIKSNESVVALNAYTSDILPWTNGAAAGLAISVFILSFVLIGTFVDWYENLLNSKIKTTGYTKETVNGHLPYASSILESSERSGLLTDVDVDAFKISSVRSQISNALKSFSFFRNTKKLVNTSTASGSLSCLNGLRVISMFWVIQGHTYEFTEILMKNPLYAIPMLQGRFSFQSIVNGTYSVDTFFFLSGLLVAYFALRELKDKGRLNWLYYFGHRYWRLTPVYAFVLLVFATLFPLTMSGPFQWVFADPDGPLHSNVNACYTYWWSNLLYLNNFYPNYGNLDGCMGWTWYLANDMQFYVVLSPVVLVLLHRWRKVGIAFSVLLIIACVGARGFIVDYYGMNQFYYPSKHMDDPWIINGPIYQRPYTRLSVYIVGMLTGFILQVSKCRIRLNKFYSTIGWSVSVATGLSVIYGLYYYHHNPGSDMSSVGTGFYTTLSRTAWSLSLAWLVIACASGWGGWINVILSWKVWAPLGRLTYCAYLIHPLILVGYNLNILEPIPFNDLFFVYLFIGNVVLSYTAAFIVSMTVEAPMMQLEKIILKKGK